MIELDRWPTTMTFRLMGNHVGPFNKTTDQSRGYTFVREDSTQNVDKGEQVHAKMKTGLADINVSLLCFPDQF